MKWWDRSQSTKCENSRIIIFSKVWKSSSRGKD